ncbi:hypothetical protein [Methylibium petroleiphilum]|uniref:hypothetical protein n=1 Tax=Methylibium petroleiphilum TaxID=105560 RepID=UPI001AD0090E|nr:hypothetical protein [Methylibium petroleiphilum]MBN9203847.1 hypothetical protein [Methylibium petroleiphilum]
MTVNLYSIEHAPRALPIWQSILDDLSNPPAARVARVLGVGTRTVYRWNRTGKAPRSACLALFWLTRWGRSEVHCAAVNDCTTAVGLARALDLEVRQLRTQLAHVLALSDSGAANDPVTQLGLAPPPKRLAGAHRETKA